MTRHARNTCWAISGLNRARNRTSRLLSSISSEFGHWIASLPRPRSPWASATISLSNSYRPAVRNDAQGAGDSQRALCLDPNSAAAHVLLGLFEHRYNWDWPAAEKEFRAVQRSMPS